MDVSVEVHCARCGSANYSLPGGSEGDATLLCNDCGEVMGSVRQLSDALMGQVVAHSAEVQRAQLDSLEGGMTPGAA